MSIANNASAIVRVTVQRCKLASNEACAGIFTNEAYMHKFEFIILMNSLYYAMHLHSQMGCSVVNKNKKAQSMFYIIVSLMCAYRMGEILAVETNL